MSISVHPEYEAAKVRLERNRDACAGEMAVKSKGRLYLPDDNELVVNGVPTGRSITSDGDKYTLKYLNYLMRASFMTIAQHTLNGWVGMVFNNPPTVDLGSSELDYLNENVDGAGQSLMQLSKRVITEVLETGRDGLLADMPVTEGKLNKSQQDALFIAPRIHEYVAENIIDWDEEKVGSITKLTYVLLRELFYDKTNENGLVKYGKPEYRYIALRLTDGVYTQQHYDDSGEPTGDVIVVRKKGGKTLDYIPFYFAGAENNKPDVDDAPISGIVDLNLNHYRNSADKENLTHLYSLPTPWVNVGNLQQGAFDEMNEDGFVMGRGLILGEGGSFGLAQVNANSATSENMTAIEAQAEKIGANYAGEGQSKNVTAEAARINAATTTSTLTKAVGNVSEAIEAALEACADMLGLSVAAVQFELNKEFYNKTKDFQAANIIIQLQQLGWYDNDDFVEEMATAGFTLTGNGIAEM